MVLGEAMASIAIVCSAPQFKTHTHTYTTYKSRRATVLKGMQEPLTSPFYWVLFGFMLLFFCAGFEFNSCLAFCIHAFHFIHSLFSVFGFLLFQLCFQNASAMLAKIAKYYIDYQGTRHSQALTMGPMPDAIWCTRVFRFH